MSKTIERDNPRYRSSLISAKWLSKINPDKYTLKKYGNDLCIFQKRLNQNPLARPYLVNKFKDYYNFWNQS